ncbi:MAG: von Willebrand factor type A domain-containing protein, partial [Lachnospiraceae bacterium]|nr:von Willebrand factor type A domain-containing protein [Lachnospiraceae bacterium]
MMNRKIMISVIASAAAAVIGLGSVSAAATGGRKDSKAADIVDDAGASEAWPEETETETETETEAVNRSESEQDSPLQVLIDSVADMGQNKSAMEEEMWDGGADGMVMAAAETGNAYFAEPAMPSWNTEEYGTVEETGFRDVKLYPLSTFGMDVDTASYSLLRRNTLNDTLSWMPKDAVRIEEMINYFNYEYEMPEDGETFSITAQIADCPWNDQTKLMLIGLQARDIPAEDIKDQNLVFLVDTSGSMYDADKLPLAVDALKYLMKELDEHDTVSIVTYAGSSEIALEPTRCTDKGKKEIIETLDGLAADGGTYGEAGIRTAYDLAQSSFIEGGNNRVLLLTDGDFNLGQTDDSELVDLVNEKAKGQIFLSILGFGTGNYNDALAQELADKGNGNYSYIDSDMEAR